jgi:hypothetical protein
VQVTDEMVGAALEATPRFELIARRDAWRVVIREPSSVLVSPAEAIIPVTASVHFQDFSSEKEARDFIKWETMRAAIAAALPLIRGAVVETDAARDVLAERQRQISVEHWTPNHDDLHGRMELSRAARCYILKAIHTENDDASYNPHLASDEQYRPPYPRFEPPQGWPWEGTAWKPKGTRADLVRAGALILAEIERLDRALSPREATDHV